MRLQNYCYYMNQSKQTIIRYKNYHMKNLLDKFNLLIRSLFKQKIQKKTEI